MTDKSISILIARAILCFGSFLFSVMLYADIDSEVASERSGYINVEQENGLYSVTAKQANLPDVLLQLAEVAKITIKILGQHDYAENNYDLESLPLDQLLDNLLWSHSTVFIYDDGPDTAHTVIHHRIKELWLIDGEKVVDDAEPSTVSKEQQLESAESIQNPDEYAIKQKRELAYIDSLVGLTSDDVIRQLNETLLAESDPIIRKRAVTALADIGGERILDALESAMGDSSADVRVELAKTFSQIHHQRSMLALGQILVGDNDVNVRMEAVRGLYKLNSLPARSFVEFALSDKNMGVKSVAQRALDGWDPLSL